MNANDKETLRLFYALWPDDLTRGELMKLQQAIHGRRIPYANLHITLAFLGQQPVSQLPALKEILTHLPTASISLTLSRVGYFSKNRIAWAGMHQVPDALLHLHQNLVQALANHGIAFDSQHKFKPHLTLARDAAPPSDLVFDPIVWRADHVALVQSVMNPEGVQYQVLASRRIDESVWIPGDSGN